MVEQWQIRWLDYYALLQIDQIASEDVIRQALHYRTYILHPDQLSGKPDKIRKRAEAEMKQVNEARDYLLDATKRAAYDTEWRKRRGISSRAGHTSGSVAKSRPSTKVRLAIDPARIDIECTDSENTKQVSLVLTSEEPVNYANLRYIRKGCEEFVRSLHGVSVTKGNKKVYKVTVDFDCHTLTNRDSATGSIEFTIDGQQAATVPVKIHKSSLPIPRTQPVMLDYEEVSSSKGPSKIITLYNDGGFWTTVKWAIRPQVPWLNISLENKFDLIPKSMPARFIVKVVSPKLPPCRLSETSLFFWLDGQQVVVPVSVHSPPQIVPQISPWPLEFKELVPNETKRDYFYVDATGRQGPKIKFDTVNTERWLTLVRYQRVNPISILPLKVEVEVDTKNWDYGERHVTSIAVGVDNSVTNLTVIAATKNQTSAPQLDNSVQLVRDGNPDIIMWDRVREHIGKRIMVQGPVVGSRFLPNTRGEPTFLNIGRPWPDPTRLAVVIWGRNRGFFHEAPEHSFNGKTIKVVGMVRERERVPEIEVATPDDIAVIEDGDEKPATSSETVRT